MRNTEQLDRLEAAAESWVGTPFCEFSSKKGAGIECQALPAEIYFEAGWIERFGYPLLNPRAANLAITDEFFKKYLHKTFDRFVTTEPGCTPEIFPGDTLIFQLGRTTHFVLVLRERRCIHVMQGAGVGIAPNLPPHWLTRLARIWRPV